MKTRLRFLASVSSFLLAAAVLAVPAGAEEVLQDEWDIVTINGQRSGYAHRVVVRKGTGDEATIVTTATQKMVIARMGATVETETTVVEVERADGSLASVSADVITSGQPTKKVWTFGPDGKGTLDVTSAGVSRSEPAEIPPDAIGSHALLQRIAATGLKEGASTSARLFSAEFGFALTVHVKVGARESIQLGEKAADGVRLAIEFVEAPMIKTVAWCDSAGTRQLRTEMDLMGMKFVTFAATQEEALAKEAGGTLAPDVFAQSLLVAAHAVPRPRSLDSVVLEITFDAPDVPARIEHGPQVIKVRTEKTLTLKNHRLVPPADAAGVRPLTDVPPEIAPNLAPNSTIQSDAPPIIAIAKKVAGSQVKAWPAAQALERWVFENIKKKNMGVAFATAAEVCQTLEGDCTEHAVLLAALCRAAGIPARVVMGLLYVGGIWGGHAWNEVWVDGTWYQLDATNGNGSVDPLHLVAGAMTLADRSSGMEMLSLLSVLGHVKIDIVKAAGNGQSFDPPARNWIHFEKGRYVDQGWGFSLDLPEGVVPRSVEPKQEISYEVAHFEGTTSDGQAIVMKIHAFLSPSPAEWRALGSEISATPLTIDGLPAFRAAKDGKETVYIAAEDTTLRVTVTGAPPGALDRIVSSIDVH